MGHQKGNAASARAVMMKVPLHRGEILSRSTCSLLGGKVLFVMTFPVHYRNDPLTTASSPSVDDLAAAFGGHTGAESVGCRPALGMRLICSLHRTILI